MEIRQKKWIAQNNRRPIVKKPPTFVNLIQTLVGPIIIVAVLRLIVEYFDVAFDSPYVVLSIVTFLLSVIVFKETVVQHINRTSNIGALARRLIIAWVVLLAVLLFLGYATKYSEVFSRRVLLTWFVLVPPFVLMGYMLTRELFFQIFTTQRFARSVVIVGVNELSRNLVHEIRTDRHLNMSFRGFFEDRSSKRYGKVDDGALLGKFENVSDYVRRNRIDLIYFALPITQEKRIIKLMDELRDTTASIYFIPDLFIFDLIQARVDDINGIPVIAVCESPIFGVTGVMKHATDIIIASLALVLVSPVMLLIAAAVKLNSPGPVIFKQKRYGLDGKEIKVYKFRTMTVLEDGGKVQQATRNDSRITKVGAFLRKTSLDELPQFFNVLQGRMSVVGPRPHAVAHNEEYRKLIKGYMMRHKVKPGITGWAQVHGFRGETEILEKMKARVDYDLDYLRHWSLGLDFLILFRTILMILKDKNAY
jgi:putative colanic acid biosynthesis UDP-glucose lipid carrier transferase